MKYKPLFTQIISLIIIAVICLLFTVAIAFLAGSINTEMFDFRNLNFSNMIPVLIIGVFISCVIIGVCFLFLARTLFFKAKDYIEENQLNNKKENKK